MVKRPTVRQATTADKAAIFEFLRRSRVSNTHFKIPYRWKWQFEENPFRKKQSLPVWVAFDGRQVVGQSCAMIEPVKVGKQELKVGWSVDTFVLPRYRGQGLGQRLQELNQNSHDVFMSLKMSHSNARIKARLGGFALPKLSLLKLRTQIISRTLDNRLARTSAQLSSAISRSGMSSLMANMYTKYLDRTWKQRTRQLKHNFTFCEVNRFGHEVLPLGRDLSTNYDLVICRDQRYLNWKFVEQPHMNHRRFLVYRQQHVVGYVVLRQCAPPEPNTGVIVDLATHSNDDKDTLSALIVFATNWFRKRQVTTIKAASTARHLKDIYRSLGFSEYRHLIPMCHLQPHVRHTLSANCRTFFSFGDHDLDQFPMHK